MGITTTLGHAFYDWPDGQKHTVSYAQHLQNMAAAGTPMGLGGRLTMPQGAALAPSATATPAAAPAAPAPSPLDATYGSGVARLLFNNTNQRNQLNTQGGQATEDFNTMLARMADNRAKDLLAQNYQANNEGLLYSGQLGKRRGDVEKGYSQQQSDAQTAYDRAATARTQALQALGTVSADPSNPLGYTGTGQAGLDLSDLYNGAVARRQALDAAGL